MSDVYKEAASKARAALDSDPQPGRETLRVLCKAAQDLAPTDVERQAWSRYLVAFSEGHRLAVKTFPTTFRVDGEIADVEMIRRRSKPRSKDRTMTTATKYLKATAVGTTSKGPVQGEDILQRSTRRSRRRADRELDEPAREGRVAL